MNYPVTPAVRLLREHKVEFEPHLYDYVERGGTSHSAEALRVGEHAVVKPLVMEAESKRPFIVLMHGDREVSTKNLARHLGVKSVQPATAETASKVTGYQFGGTSPFGTRMKLPVYVESTIYELDRIYINGGKRGFLVEIDPTFFRSLDAEEIEVGIEI